MTADTVLLVRHGETEWNREGRMQGWGPTPLNDRGREQARRVGNSLAAEYDIDRIVASDSFRTRETTELIRNAGIDAEPTFDSGWRERGLGIYQGFLRSELNKRFPAFAYDAGALSLEKKPEGGESVAEVYERVGDAWDQLLDSLDGETVLVVTHGGPIRLVLARLYELDALTAIRKFAITNCSLTEIQPESEAVVRENEQLFEPVPPR